MDFTFGLAFSSSTINTPIIGGVFSFEDNTSYEFEDNTTFEFN
jgi:hypothetical protein